MAVAKYQKELPQLRSHDLFLADGGIETTLIFLHELDLPHFAAFHLLQSEEGQNALRKYFRTYAQLADNFNIGLVLESPTWRASRDWGKRLEYSDEALAEKNKESVGLLKEVREQYEKDGTPIVISGCIGPRGDGYEPEESMSAKEAEEYHRLQVEAFANSAADVVTAITMNYVNEALGIIHAAKQAQVPVIISFTVETDGKLPTGQALGDAIKYVDEVTDNYVTYFMINCAHPTHLDHAIRGDEEWVSRVRGLRANASRLSHAELDEATELDIGDPEELGKWYAQLRKEKLKHMNVMGGCCGTDERHIEQIAKTCLPLFQ